MLTQFTEETALEVFFLQHMLDSSPQTIVGLALEYLFYPESTAYRNIVLKEYNEMISDDEMIALLNRMKSHPEFKKICAEANEMIKSATN